MRTLKSGPLSFSLCFVVLSVLACAPSATTAPKAATSPSPSPTAKLAAPPGTSPTTSPSATAEVPPTSAVTFAGKTIVIVVASAAGGGSDINARAWARHLPNFLPGKPTVIVRNMPGGGGTLGGNYVYGSKPDGLTALAGTGTVYMPYVTGMSAAKYDLNQMDAVMANATSNIYFIRPGIVKAIEDLPRTKGIIYGSPSGGSGTMFVSAVEVLNLQPDKVVLAYGGVAEALRAFLAGEINASTQTAAGYIASIKALVEKREVQLLWQAGVHDDKGNLVKDPAYPSDVPTVKEVYEKVHGKSPTGMAWDAYNGLAGINNTYNKTLLLPPKTPQNILNIYFDATTRMIKDPDFQKDTALLVGEGSAWYSGKALAEQFRAKMVLDPKVIEWIKNVFSSKYGLTF